MEWGGGSRRGGRKADWRALLAALTLCVTTSARINEVTALTRADVLPGGRLRIAATLVPIPGRAVERQRHTKGKKVRAGEPGPLVVLTARGRDVVEQLLEAAGPDATAPLFPNRDGGHPDGRPNAESACVRSFATRRSSGIGSASRWSELRLTSCGARRRQR